VTTATVFIVDDDPGIRESLPVLMETAGLKAECFASAEAFLDACDHDQEGCLLLDVRMPGLSGLQLQVELARRKIGLPVIFLTAYADLATGVDAMKQGAMDFLTKPVNGALLLQRVQAALAVHREQRRTDNARQSLLSRLQKLSCRERDVLALALTGTTSREIAERLRISLRTVEGHRARIYLKTGSASLLELSRTASDLGLSVSDITALSRTS
jgi:two-component system, LuxR family, response regulator FixJ